MKKTSIIYISILVFLLLAIQFSTATTTITSPSDYDEVVYDINFLGTTTMGGTGACILVHGSDGVFDDARNSIESDLLTTPFNITTNACDKNLFGVTDFKVVCINTTSDEEEDIIYNLSVTCANESMITESTISLIGKVIITFAYFIVFVVVIFLFIFLKKKIYDY